MKGKQGKCYFDKFHDNCWDQSREGRAARDRARLEPKLSSLASSAQLGNIFGLSLRLSSARDLVIGQAFGSARLQHIQILSLWLDSAREY